MAQRSFVILDRDGTLNTECNYLSDPDQLELVQGAGEGLLQMKRMGLGLVVITNQSGVGRGFFDLARLRLIHKRLNELLCVKGVELDGLYVCPHRPEDDCPCRKPKPGLFLLAAKELDFDPRSSFVIGDQISDMELGRNVGAKTILVRTGYGVRTSVDMDGLVDCKVDNLFEAARKIEEWTDTKPV